MNNYEIDSISGKIDRSGVFLGKDKTTGRRVAIKLFSSLSDSQKNRLLNEAKSLQSLTHPHVVQLLDYGVDEDHNVYYVIEYLEGMPLYGMIPVGQGMSFQESWPIIEKLGSALSAVHQAGILHLDLKPGNVLMVSGEPKVIDFGMIAPEEPGKFRGTPGYVAPEVILGKASTVQSDIYSFGVLLAYIWTGDKLVHGDSPENILAHQLKELSVSMHNQDLARVISRATKKDPVRRYANIAEMLKPLQLYAHEQEYCSLEPSEEIGQSQSGHWVIGAVVTSLVCIAVGIYYFLLNSI